MTKEFKRGLCPMTWPKVKDFFNTTSVGKAIKQSPDLEICIRDNYINIYNNGCSILEYCPNAKTNIFNIHQKYLPGNNAGQKYIHLKMKDGDLTLPDTDFSFVRDIIVKPNQNLRSYIDVDSESKYGEKKYISDYLRNTDSPPFMLDLEIAYSKKNSSTERGYAPRIDLACIDPGSNKLQFIEVKTLSDPRTRLGKSHIDKDCRDSTNAGFEVLEQMEDYKNFINDENKQIQIQDSYRNIAKNYIDIGLTNKFPSSGGFTGTEILERFYQEGTIDPEPFLLLFLDGAKRTGKYGDNIEALKSCFEKFEEFSDRYLFQKVKS